MSRLRYTVERRDEAFAITAMTGKSSVARIGAMHDGHTMRVRRIDVVPGSRREGVATGLYERAARLACRVYHVPLASDIERSPRAEAFWRKQVAKGRAQRRTDGHEGYVLSCPAPRSLAGRR